MNKTNQTYQSMMMIYLSKKIEANKLIPNHLYYVKLFDKFDKKIKNTKTKKCFLLHFEKEISKSEIAQKEGVSLQVIYKRIKFFLKKLDELENESIEKENMKKDKSGIFENWEQNRKIYGIPQKESQIYRIFDIEKQTLRKPTKDDKLDDLLILEEMGKILIFA